MPNCFQLTRIGETEATPLVKIDEELCELLGREVHPTLYVIGWFDCIGFLLACGKTFEQIKVTIVEWYPDEMSRTRCEEMLRCCEYLEQHFVSSAWVEIGRR